MRTLQKVTVPDVSGDSLSEDVLANLRQVVGLYKEDEFKRFCTKLRICDIVVIGSPGCLMTYVNGWQPRSVQQKMPETPNVVLSEASLICSDKPTFHNENFLMLTAIRDIAAGEELFFIYGPRYGLQEDGVKLQAPPVYQKTGTY